MKANELKAPFYEVSEWLKASESKMRKCQCDQCDSIEFCYSSLILLLESENARFRDALELIAQSQLCRIHNCGCGLSPEDIAQTALEGK